MAKSHSSDTRIMLRPSQSFARKLGRIMLVVSYGLLASVLILLGVLVLRSPGKPLPYVDEGGNPLAGSMVEKIWLAYDGRQGVF